MSNTKPSEQVAQPLTQSPAQEPQQTLISSGGSTREEWHCPVPNCEQRESSPNRMGGHLLSKHQDYKTRIVCQFCRIPADSAKEFAIHVFTYHGSAYEDDGRYRCQADNCNKLYLTAKKFRKHMLQKHGIDTETGLPQSEPPKQKKSTSGSAETKANQYKKEIAAAADQYKEQLQLGKELIETFGDSQINNPVFQDIITSLLIPQKYKNLTAEELRAFHIAKHIQKIKHLALESTSFELAYPFEWTSTEISEAIIASLRNEGFKCTLGALNLLFISW